MHSVRIKLKNVHKMLIINTCLMINPLSVTALVIKNENWKTKEQCKSEPDITILMKNNKIQNL